MYSNYLAEAGKLVFIIGQIDITSNFKKLLQLNSDSKNKFFFKCVDQLPVGTYKKEKKQCRRKGILRCDWFTKVMDKSPMMIFMVFNYANNLEANQKWDDRLIITLRKINKVYDILRSSNKEQVVLRIIIIISKQAVLQSFQNGNITDKITSFLKNYQKQLNIYQSDQLTKQVKKNKTYWFTMLDKAYEKKYRAINKRKEESFGERRLGCLIKMAVITEIIQKKDSYAQYEEAYRSLHFRFVEMMKNNNKIDFVNFDSIRELRVLADIVLLRKLIVKIAISNNFQNVQQKITNHMRYFYQNTQNDHFYFSYQTMIWRQNFLQNLLQVLHTNCPWQIIPKPYFCQLINTTISLSYKLCKASLEIEPFLCSQIKGRMIPIKDQVYIGSRNYEMGIEITDLDILWTEMNQIIDRKKDFIARGLQTINRYKKQKIFKKHEVNFFNVYLLRFYLADQKFSSIGNIFNQIIKMKISQYDFYSLNYLIDELEKQTEKSSQHILLIHSLAVLISDYFRNKGELEKYGMLLVNSLGDKRNTDQSVDLLGQTVQDKSNEKAIQKDPIILPLQNQSLTFSLQVLFPDKMHSIQKPLKITIFPKFNSSFLIKSNKKAKIKLFFNIPQIKCQKQINFSSLSLQQNPSIELTIDPLLYFSKDENLEIVSAVLIIQTDPQLHFLIQNISYSKYQSVLMMTKLKIPQIVINMPYQIYYNNQISKFLISLSTPKPLNAPNSTLSQTQTQKQTQTKTDITFSVLQQQQTGTEIFMSMEQKLNLINSNVFQSISSHAPNVIYMKCNKVGPKAIKFVFDVTVIQHIGGKELKDHHTITREVGFKVHTLFKTLKVLKQAFTGNQIKQNQIPTNKNVIMSYNVRASQTVKIVQLGQYNNPKQYIVSHKDITPIQNYTMSSQQKLNNVYIFSISEQPSVALPQKQLFLTSFYIKWSRTDMQQKLKISSTSSSSSPAASSPIINLYNQDDIKISIKSDKVQIQYQQGKTLKKRQKQSLTITYRNLTNNPIHIYSMMDSNEDILRIGSRGMDLQLGPRESGSLCFWVLPVRSGYFRYPQVRSFFDGLESKQSGCAGIVSVL